jgi:hypothetical protein
MLNTVVYERRINELLKDPKEQSNLDRLEVIMQHLNEHGYALGAVSGKYIIVPIWEEKAQEILTNMITGRGRYKWMSSSQAHPRFNRLAEILKSRGYKIQFDRYDGFIVSR